MGEDISLDNIKIIDLSKEIKKAVEKDKKVQEEEHEKKRELLKIIDDRRKTREEVIDLERELKNLQLNNAKKVSKNNGYSMMPNKWKIFIIISMVVLVAGYIAIWGIAALGGNLSDITNITNINTNTQDQSQSSISNSTAIADNTNTQTQIVNVTVNINSNSS